MQSFGIDFSIIFFISKISIEFFISSNSPLRLLIYFILFYFLLMLSFFRLFFSSPLVSSMFLIAHWSDFMMFMMDALESLPDNSSISVSSMLVYTDCIFHSI